MSTDVQVLERLAQSAGTYAGEGINHEEQPFVGELHLEEVAGGRGVLLRYITRGPDDAVYHTEVTTVAPREDGELCVWPVMSELPALLVHELVSTSESPSGRLTAVFRHGDPADEEVFRQELVIDLWPNGDVGYRHAWGLPLGVYKERSGVRMKRVDPSELEDDG